MGLFRVNIHHIKKWEYIPNVTIFIKGSKESLFSLKEIQYTKNKSLNDVLNETVGLGKSQKESVEYPTLGGGAFDTSRMSAHLIQNRLNKPVSGTTPEFVAETSSLE